MITALQNERNWTAAQLVGVDQRLEMDITGYDATRAETDAALTQFEREIGRRGGVATAAYAPALEGLAALDELRAEIDVAAGGLTSRPTQRRNECSTGHGWSSVLGGMSRISIRAGRTRNRKGPELMEVVTRQLETITQLTNASRPQSEQGEGDEAASTAAETPRSRGSRSLHRQAEALRTAGDPAGDGLDWTPRVHRVARRAGEKASPSRIKSTSSSRASMRDKTTTWPTSATATRSRRLSEIAPTS